MRSPVPFTYIGITNDVTCDLEKFWTLETTGTEPHKDSVLSANQQFLKHYSKNSITRLNGKSYYAKLPWKEHHPPLPSNYVCLRVRSLTKRLAQTPGMLQLYDGVIQDQVHRGFIEWVDISNTPNTGKVHYIPHHCVKKNSATTPEWYMIVAAANPEVILLSMTVYHSVLIFSTIAVTIRYYLLR